MAWVGKSLKLLPMLLLCGCVGATAAAYFADEYWLLELFSHFRVQYVVLLTVLTLFYAWKRQAGALTIALSCAVLNIVPIAGFFVSRPNNDVPPVASEGIPWTLLSANLNSGNKNAAAVLGHLATEQAHVVVLQEYNARWAEELSELQTRYPFHFRLPREDNFGLALFSQWPLLSAEAIDLGGSTPAIVAKLTTASGPLQIIAVHLRPPLTADRAAQRARQFAALTQLAAETELPLAVVGDFNATPWSPQFHRWIHTAKLSNGLGGQGLAYTWPTTMPMFRIPIDACVVNDGLKIVAQRRGNRIGSDHYPVVTTLIHGND